MEPAELDSNTRLCAKVARGRVFPLCAAVTGGAGHVAEDRWGRRKPCAVLPRAYNKERGELPRHVKDAVYT